MLNLLFPKLCNGCKAPISKEQEVLCVRCRHDLPLACHHKTGNEAMKNLFYGRLPVENATALFFFHKKGITQQLMHNLKYRRQQNISSFFGRWLGAELSQIPSYRKIDIVIPVPLHKKKLKKRGYNQVEGFAEEIARSLQVSYRNDILIKISSTASQVFKQRLTRFQAEEIFTVRTPEAIQNKHILLVDDIITTGATLENCALQLLKGTEAKVSLATMAIA